MLLAGCGGADSAGQSQAPRTTQRASAITGVTPTASGGTTVVLPPGALHTTHVPAVVATVDGMPVPKWLYISQVNFTLWVRESPAAPGARWTRLPQSQIATLERQALRRVVDNTLIVRYGERHGWAPAGNDVADAYARVVQRRGGPAASARQIAQDYLTVDQDRMVVRNGMIAQQVLDHFIAARHQAVVALSIRLIATRSLREASSVRARLVASGQWVMLAKRYSIDAVGRAAGGEQPIATADGFDPRVWRAAYHVAPGAISAPIHVGNSWVVLQVRRRFPAAAMFRQDLVDYQAWLAAMERHAAIWSYLGAL